jgi:hypothetical protein
VIAASIVPPVSAGCSGSGPWTSPRPISPAWGPGGIRTYFDWRNASEHAFKKVPVETAIRRARKAEELGLTYREYHLEILERGRFLQKEDTARIAEIIARRSQR